MQKRKAILVVARCNQVEALRIAVGLTLLDDAVKVDVLGALENTPQTVEQMEVLEFADVPLEENQDPLHLARHIMDTDVVFVI